MCVSKACHGCWALSTEVHAACAFPASTLHASPLSHPSADVAEAVEPLVASLHALSGPETRVYISHGRNRQVRSAAWGCKGEHASFAASADCHMDCNGTAYQLVCILKPVSPEGPGCTGRQTSSYGKHQPPPDNLQAEPQFLAAAGQHFDITTVPPEDLDEVYQCADVDVLLLNLKQPEEQQGERATRVLP